VANTEVRSTGSSFWSEPAPSTELRDTSTRSTPHLGVRAALGVVTASYITFFSYVTVRNHYGFGTFSFDLGIFDQGVWLLSRFKTPFITLLGLNLFGDHTSFILFLLVPLYWIFPSAAVLLVTQAAALGVGALPTFLIARHKLQSERLALGVAVAYLINPVIAWTNLEQFHPDSFEVPLALFAIYFMLRRKWTWFAVFVAALLLVKEDVFLLTVTLGLYVAVYFDRRVGLLTALASIAWFALAFRVILPALNGVGTLDSWRLTGEFGSIGGLFIAAVTHPWRVAAVALGPGRPWYLWQLLAPLALLPLLSPGLLIVAAGPLLSNTLSSFGYQHDIRYHYSTLIIPVLVCAAILGIGRFPSPRVRAGFVGLLAASALVTCYLWGPFGRNAFRPADPGRPEAAAERHAIALIPPQASVSGTYFLTPHLDYREHVYDFPNPWRASYWAGNGTPLPDPGTIDYVVVAPRVMDDDSRRVFDSLQSRDFQTIYRSHGIVVLRRRNT
jgi:uncharacterized membrane protein